MSNSVQKSNFAQTCNLLSQFMKEKGSFGNLKALETSRRQQQQPTMEPTTTMDLLPNLEKNNNSVAASSNVTTTDFFPNSTPCFGSGVGVGGGGGGGGGSSSQMTIFYGGRVIILNDLPAEKAQEIIAFASKESNIASTSTISGSSNKNSMNIVATNQKRLHRQLPQANRASLHRFFEKRKERVTAKAPYQVNNNTITSRAAAAKAEEEGKSWFDVLEGQSSSKQLDLNF